MNLTSEQLEQLRNLRALVDHLEAGGGLEMNIGSYNNPIWKQRGLNVFLDHVAWYRAMPKPTSRFYTVEELIKAGARYLHVYTAMYTIVNYSVEANSLTIITNKPVDFDPCGFHHRDFTWSIDGRERKSFVKED